MCSEPAIAHTQRHSSRKIPASADTSSPQKGLIRPGGTRVSQKGAIMVAIRKTKAKEEFGPDPSLDLPQGAHLKVMSAKLFPPRFHEETGDLWKSVVSCKLEVVDDRTVDGDADGLEFFDTFELKVDEELGYDDKKLKDANIRNFTKEQQQELLDQDTWTVRTGSKLDNLLNVLYGEVWIKGEMDFDPDDLVDKEFIAKVHPRTGKKPGSYTGWETFMSLNPPKKKKFKLQETQEETADTADLLASAQVAQDLTEAEWAQAKEVVR